MQPKTPCAIAQTPLLANQQFTRPVLVENYALKKFNANIKDMIQPAATLVPRLIGRVLRAPIAALPRQHALVVAPALVINGLSVCQRASTAHVLTLVLPPKLLPITILSVQYASKNTHAITQPLSNLAQLMDMIQAHLLVAPTAAIRNQCVHSNANPQFGHIR